MNLRMNKMRFWWPSIPTCALASKVSCESSWVSRSTAKSEANVGNRSLRLSFQIDELKYCYDVTQNFFSFIKGFGAEEGFQPLHENGIVRGVTSFKAHFYASHLFVFEVWLMFKWNSSRYMFDLLIDVLSLVHSSSRHEPGRFRWVWNLFLWQHWRNGFTNRNIYTF